jgi:uncharacterized protein YceK
MKTIGLWISMLLLLSGCHSVVKQYKAVYTVDPATVWETIELTPQGVHYGIDMAGMVKHDLFRTFWMQKRSANSPYLYEKLQVNLNCRDRQMMWLMRTQVQNNEVIKIQTTASNWWPDRIKDAPFSKWQPIEADTLEDKLADKVCLTPDKR